MGRSGVGLGRPVSAIARLQDVAVAYRGRVSLEGVSGAIERHSLTAVVGCNGAGKSTLLKAITGMVPLHRGKVELGVERARIAYLAQQTGMERNFPLSVLDCVVQGFWPASRLWRRVPVEAIEAAYDALESVGLADLAERPVGALSAGQFQRMLFVRVQLQDADFILLDEPFNAVDARTTDALLHTVAAWHEQGRTVMAVLHDHQQVRNWFPQTLLLARSVVAWGDTASVLTEENLWRTLHLADTAQPRAA
jgi:zinc/manganese transport system ATP-binding protein